jgi:hypothetical protein
LAGKLAGYLVCGPDEDPHRAKEKAALMKLSRLFCHSLLEYGLKPGGPLFRVAHRRFSRNAELFGGPDYSRRIVVYAYSAREQGAA